MTDKKVELKDYKMTLKYATENFFGLSEHEQISLLNDLKEYTFKSGDQWLIDNFQSVYSDYYMRMIEIVTFLEYYLKQDEEVKMKYRINETRKFWDTFSTQIENVSSLKKFDDNLEYDIYGKCYYPTSINNSQFINPNKIYLQDLALDTDEEKEEFCISMIHMHKNKLNHDCLPVASRIIKLYDPIILDLYGEEIFNFIKSKHHSLNENIINYIALFVNTDNYLEFKSHQNDLESLDKELKSVRKQIHEKLNESTGYCKQKSI